MNAHRHGMTASVTIAVVAFLFSPNVCADTFRIATYNLNWGNRNGGDVLDAIAEADPDLVAFQETTPASERFLRQHLAKTHPHFHAAGHHGQYAAERFAFASKNELKDLTFVPPTAGLFGFYSAKLRVAGTRIHVVNVHLTPFRLKRGGGIRDAMAALSATEAKHGLEIEAIVRTIDCERPTIVLGDFNSISSFKAPRRLAELGLVDAFASTHEDADAHPTWTWPTRPLPLSLRIDYIFHTAHFRTREAELIRRDGSDHVLLVAELGIEE